MSDKPLEPRSSGSLPERAFVLAVATLVLLTPPVLSIFDVPVTILGIPLLHIYSFAVWLVAIVLGGIIAGRLREDSPPAGDAAPPAKRRPGLTAMLTTPVIVTVSLAYLGILFAIAWYGDWRAKVGRSLIRSPVVYTFSLAVYCTTWTFYGAVGTAAHRGLEFITIYTGPTIVFLGWWFLLRKIVRISKTQRITSIADFVASRYGKSAFLGMIVTVIALVGTMPYIALQLKAVSSTFAVLSSYGRLPDFADRARRTPARDPRRCGVPDRHRHGDLRDPFRHPPHRRQRAP